MNPCYTPNFSLNKVCLFFVFGMLISLQGHAITGGEQTFITFQSQALNLDTEEPLAFSHIIVFLDDERICDAMTDENGHFSVELPANMPFEKMKVKIKGERFWCYRNTGTNTNELNVCSTMKFQPDSSQRFRLRKKKKVGYYRITGCPSF